MIGHTEKLISISMELKVYVVVNEDFMKINVAVYAWVLPHLPLCTSSLCSGGLYYCHFHIFRQSP